MEVTDWTAAPTALLPGEQPLHSAVTQDGDLAQMGHHASPLPRWLGAELGAQVFNTCPGAVPSATRRVREQAQPQACGYAWGLPSQPTHQLCWNPETQVQPCPPCTAQIWRSVAAWAETSTTSALQRQPLQWHSQAWCPPHSGAWQSALEPSCIPGSSEMLLWPGAGGTTRRN